MPKNVNTSYLGNDLDESLDEGKKTMIKVDHVSMVFNIANQKLNSLKEWFIALAHHEIRFKEFRALDDISFEVKQGDVFGILGTNGSGKSTMLKIVAGVLEPTEGTVETTGRISPLIELGAGFDMDLTARENVYLNGALLGYPKDFIDEHMDEIIEFAEVEDFMDMPLKNYSSGMVARIAFSIATVMVPDILIVDEVLAVGDFMFQQKCERRITDIIKNHGVTVLIVSHNTAQIERLCNKAIWIEKGHTRMMGSAREVCRAYRVVGGRVGSEESEQRIMQVMNTKTLDYKKFCGALWGSDRYVTNVKLAEGCIKGREDKPKTVILAPSTDIVAAMTGTALAMLEDAVLLSIDSGFVPGATRKFLRGLDPEHVIALDSQGSLAPDIWDAFDRDGISPETSTISASDETDLCLKVYEYGKGREGGWGKTAVLSYSNAIAGLISVSPIVYQKKAPVFVLSAENSGSNDEICGIVARDFEEAIIVEQGFLVDESIVDRLEKAGISIVRFSDDDPCRLNKQIDRWIIAKREEEGLLKISKFLQSTTEEPVDAYQLGPYATLLNYLIVFSNPSSLDETARNLDFLEELDGDITHITFVGGKSRFSDDDRSIYVKSMIMARHEAGKLMPGEENPEEKKPEAEKAQESKPEEKKPEPAKAGA